MTFFTNTSHKPQAEIAGDQMVLSLPDAMTPVVWMIDMKQTGSFFVRVEDDKNGLFILQKLSGSGKNLIVEDIAYYERKDKAVRAMTLIGDSLKNPSRRPKRGGFLKTLGLFLLSLVVFFILFLLFLYALGNGWMDFGSQETVQPTVQEAPIVGSSPDHVGVPLSADDFLNERGNNGLPF